jgi:hypothetical protein
METLDHAEANLMDENKEMAKAILFVASFFLDLLGVAIIGAGAVWYSQARNSENNILAVVLLLGGFVELAIGLWTFFNARRIHDTPVKTT